MAIGVCLKGYHKQTTTRVRDAAGVLRVWARAKLYIKKNYFFNKYVRFSLIDVLYTWLPSTKSTFLINSSLIRTSVCPNQNLAFFAHQIFARSKPRKFHSVIFYGSSLMGRRVFSPSIVEFLYKQSTLLTQKSTPKVL